MSKLNLELKKLGFLMVSTGGKKLADGKESVTKDILLFEKKLTSKTSLFIEGKRKKSCSTYVFDFYKMRFFLKKNENGKIEGTDLKFYGENLPPAQVLKKAIFYVSKLKMEESK